VAACLAAGVAAGLAACSHAQTVCPRGAALARRIYTGGGESEWCRRDSDRVRQGAEVRYYESGVKLMEGLYVDGVQHGTWRYYWNTGEMWREESWNDGELVAQKIVTRAAKLSAAQHGELGFSGPGAAVKIAAYDSLFRHRQQEQEARSFSERYPDGKPRVLGRYDGDGARWGMWWFWYPNGQLAREVEYDAGVRNRGFREWYDTGHARTDGEFLAGRKESHWRRWDAAGHLSEDNFFHDGARMTPPVMPDDGPVIESPP
jgi:antitoxin component YwqK of YwqJK toxin-antitoxin module